MTRFRAVWQLLPSMSTRVGPVPSQPLRFVHQPQPTVPHADRLKALESYTPKKKVSATGVSLRSGTSYGYRRVEFRAVGQLNTYLRDMLGYSGFEQLVERPNPEGRGLALYWEQPPILGAVSPFSQRIVYDVSFEVQVRGRACYMTATIDERTGERVLVLEHPV